MCYMTTGEKSTHPIITLTSFGDFEGTHAQCVIFAKILPISVPTKIRLMFYATEFERMLSMIGSRTTKTFVHP